MKHILRLFILVSSAVFVACEPMDAVDPFGIIHDDKKSETSGQSQSLSGVWGGNVGDIAGQHYASPFRKRRLHFRVSDMAAR